MNEIEEILAKTQGELAATQFLLREVSKELALLRDRAQETVAAHAVAGTVYAHDSEFIAQSWSLLRGQVRSAAFRCGELEEQGWL